MTSQPKPVKICTLGESGAGKSSLIMRLTTGNFSANQVRLRASLTLPMPRNTAGPARVLMLFMRVQQTTIGAAFVAWNSPDGATRLEIWCDLSLAVSTAAPSLAEPEPASFLCISYDEPHMRAQGHGRTGEICYAGANVLQVSHASSLQLAQRRTRSRAHASAQCSNAMSVVQTCSLTLSCISLAELRMEFSFVFAQDAQADAQACRT